MWVTHIPPTALVDTQRWHKVDRGHIRIQSIMKRSYPQKAEAMELVEGCNERDQASGKATHPSWCFQTHSQMELQKKPLYELRARFTV